MNESRTVSGGQTFCHDLVVVGGGINGMVCALLAAEDGLDVLLLEAHQSLGGGVRTKELTLPGFRHDVCSAVHPFGKCSPILRSLNLEAEGLQWVEPIAPVAHPLPDQEAVILYRDIERTVEGLGSGGKFYGTVMKHLVADWDLLEEQLLGPTLRFPNVRTLTPLMRFGPLALSSASLLGPCFGSRGAALWAGLAAHSLLPMEALSSSAVACVLGLLAHKVGWPSPKGGAAQLALALEKRMRRAGVKVQTESQVTDVSEIPKSRGLVLDLSAKQVLSLLSDRLPRVKRLALERYRLGPGIFKMDFALSEPVPWADPGVAQAGTVHLGGHLPNIARSERAIWNGQVADDPFLLAVQPTLFDPTRAPEGKHTFWIYLHAPNGWEGDARELIERRMEFYAPGFRDIVLGSSAMSAQDFQDYNPNYIGGDILGGANTLWQVMARPTLSVDPYHLVDNTFCCSASVPPGGGVHGMGGYHAYQSLKRRMSV